MQSFSLASEIHKTREILFHCSEWVKVAFGNNVQSRGRTSLERTIFNVDTFARLKALKLHQPKTYKSSAFLIK